MESFKSMISRHKAPWECTFAKEDNSQCEPGSPPNSEGGYFEVLALCILQAGFNWRKVRAGWPQLRRAFQEFDVQALAKADPQDLLQRPGIIKNRRKIEAIIANALRFQHVQREYGSFAQFINALKAKEDREAIDSLTKRFRHVGGYSAEYYLHSIGYWTEKATAEATRA
jgi:DNA-3-methyladenine glycosylase I